MRVLVQRVASASVTVGGEVVACIDRGLLLLVGFTHADDESQLAPIADKIANLRIFSDDAGRFQFSVMDVGGDVLAVPQFTLYGDARRGRRPDFTAALDPALARELFDGFVEALRIVGVPRVEFGRFGAHMSVALVNDGPVTIMLER